MVLAKTARDKNTQAKVTTLGTEMKSKACSFWGNKLQADRPLKMWMSYLFFLHSWFQSCGDVTGLFFILHTTTTDMQETDQKVIFNVKYYACTLCLHLQSSLSWKGHFTQERFTGVILAEISTQQMLTRLSSRVWGCWLTFSMKDFM